MKKNNKGFTLMEMLIVVAIIGVLVAIAIPTINNSLDKSKKAADEANIRAAISQVSANYLLNETGDKLSVDVGPMQAACTEGVNIGGYIFKSSADTAKGEAKAWAANDVITVKYDTENNKCTFTKKVTE